MQELQQWFDALAVTFGDRWADLPWEAVLSAGPAEAVIEACASDLLQPDGDALLFTDQHHAIKAAAGSLQFLG